MINGLMAVIFFWGIFAPLPPGIAVNQETRECGQYMGGDERASYLLPAEWEIYYPDPGLFQTSAGSCSWDGRNAQTCCEQLGYTYVPGNLATLYGQRQLSPYGSSLLCLQVLPFVLLVAVISAGVIFFLKRKSRRRIPG
jgi:hypothetical protein